MSEQNSPQDAELIDELDADPIQNEQESENDHESASDENESESNDESSKDEEERKHPKGFEKRVKKLASQRDSARQEVEYWKQAAMGRGNQQPQEYQPQPDTSVRPQRQQYASEDDYLEALTDFKVEQKLASRDSNKAAVTIAETYSSRVKEFMKAVPDFDEEVQEAVHLNGLDNDTIRLIQKSEVGPQITWELVQNPDLANRLKRMPSSDRMYELGKLEAKLEKGTATKAPSTNKVSKAPAPLNTPKGKSAGSKPNLADPDLDFREWRKLRHQK